MVEKNELGYFKMAHKQFVHYIFAKIRGKKVTTLSASSSKLRGNDGNGHVPLWNVDDNA